MEVQRKTILDAIEKISCGLATNGVLPEMMNINYEYGVLVTYNGPIMAMTDLDLGEAAFSVPAAKFINTVKTMPDTFQLLNTETAIEFTAKGKKSKTNFGIAKHEGENIILKSADSLQTYIEEQNDKNDHDESLLWDELPLDFETGVKLCMFSAAKTTNLGTLSCLSFNKDCITSSDNMRISAYRMEKEMDTFLLPASVCASILQLKPKYYHLQEDGRTLLFTNDENDILCIRTVSGDYPNYSAIAFDTKYEEKEDLILPEEIIDMVKSVGTVNADVQSAEQYITISLKDSVITVETTHQSGWGKQEVELDYDLDLDFCVSTGCPAFLEILKHSAQIKLTKDDNRLVFCSEHYRHVLPLLQAKKEE